MGRQTNYTNEKRADYHTTKKKDPVGAIFGARIRQIRKAQNMGQRELADRCFVTYASVLQWELGYTCPTVDKLVRIAKGLGVPFRDLFNFEELEEQING